MTTPQPPRHAIDAWMELLRDMDNGMTAERAAAIIASHPDPELARLREKIENQRQRIVYLEGATNHATGTPLSLIKAERDQLRADLKRAVEQRDGMHERHNRNAVYCEELRTTCTRLRSRVAELVARILADNKAFGCELRDPNGTIWEYAETLKKRVDELELQTFDIKKLETENARLQMEVDSMCSAEELRQVRASNAELVTRCHQLEKDHRRLGYVRKHFANAIHYGCRTDGDEWNADFYGTLDKWMVRDAARNAQPAANTGDNHRTEAGDNA